MKPQTYHYFALHSAETSTRLEFKNFDDFCKLAELAQEKNIFLVPEAGKECTPSYFAFLYHNALVQQPTEGFQTIEDRHTAVKNNFPDAAAFYSALKEGYTNFEEFTMIQEAGISDKAIFDAMKEQGFIKGFEEYLRLLQENTSLPETEPINNSHELYHFAKNKGFTDYKHFITALTKGFTDADTYKIASDLHFPTAYDYKDAIARNFRTYTDLEAARKLKIRNDVDFRRYIDLQFLEKRSIYFDQRILLVLLSKLEQGKKISFNKLSDLFYKSLDEYRYPDTGEMPEWFTIGFENKEAIIPFLLKNEHIKQYGQYDEDGEFFEINHMKDRTIVIDGSNIAYNSNGNSKAKPYIANIIKMAEYLKAKKFTEVIVIVDASLKHRLVDAEKIEALKAITQYLEAPKENPADIFIIQYVKRNHCLLVSNDTFREWKFQDPWVAENIDFYRLSFMIKGDEVLMPDLK